MRDLLATGDIIPVSSFLGCFCLTFLPLRAGEVRLELDNYPYNDYDLLILSEVTTMLNSSPDNNMEKFPIWMARLSYSNLCIRLQNSELG
jgi:hypothetical protein